MLQGDVGAQDTIIIDVEDGKLVARSSQSGANNISHRCQFSLS